jgi:acyl-CoA synthetase (AMP-forming)/AMP-acid ligase II
LTETLLDAFATSVARNKDRVALVEGDGTRVTFAKLAARVQTLAQTWSAQGMRAGDRILIALPIGADLYAALAAIWTIGAVAVLPEPAMGFSGLRNALRTTDVQGLCASGPYRALRLLLPAIWTKPLYTPSARRYASLSHRAEPAHLALISFTSGTTGAPKAIPRTHAFLMAQKAAVDPLLQSERPEVDLVAFPVFVLINLAAGRTSVLPNWQMRKLHRLPSNALASWIANQGVTRLLLPPALCQTLAYAPIPPQVHSLFTGGGPVFPDLIATLRAKAPDLRIISVYGSTEAEPIAELDARDCTPDDLADMAAGKGLLAGFPVAATQVRILNDEILVSGTHVNQGYLDPARDVETKMRDGTVIWHRTGDAGYFDDQGRLWLLGRLGGAVQTATGICYPFSIETAARMWPGARGAALVTLAGKAVLAVEGDPAHLPDWTARAAAFGIHDLRPVAHLPKDRRHRSKVDIAALRKMLGG